MRSVTHKLRDRFFLQQGAALVTALGVTSALVAFGVAVTATVSTNIGETGRDKNVKRAFAASEAGIQEATYRMNMLQPTETEPCVTVTGGLLVRTGASGPDGWCGEEAVSVGDSSVATYRLSPYVISNGVVTRSVVSTGTVNGVSRRLKVSVSANTGAPLFDPFALSSDNTLTLAGNANVNGSVRSNQNINLSGNAAVCGTNVSATPGVGYTVNLGNNSSVCGSTQPATAPFTLTPVDQGDAAVSNDNSRFFSQDPKTGTVTWNSATRQLSMSGNSTLTLGGHTYSFCSLTLSGNAQLTIAANVTVRIFIDSTSNCGLANNTTQFSMGGNTKLINTSQDPTHLQIYMLGGTADTPNSATLAGNSTATQMTFYAPRTNLSITGNGSAYTGALVAKQISITGNGATANYDSRVESISQATIGVYRPQQFVECTPVNTSGTPDSGC